MLYIRPKAEAVMLAPDTLFELFREHTVPSAMNPDNPNFRNTQDLANALSYWLTQGDSESVTKVRISQLREVLADLFERVTSV